MEGIIKRVYSLSGKRNDQSILTGSFASLEGYENWFSGFWTDGLIPSHVEGFPNNGSLNFIEIPQAGFKKDYNVPIIEIPLEEKKRKEPNEISFQGLNGRLHPGIKNPIKGFTQTLGDLEIFPSPAGNQVDPRPFLCLKHLDFYPGIVYPSNFSDFLDLAESLGVRTPYNRKDFDRKDFYDPFSSF